MAGTPAPEVIQPADMLGRLVAFNTVSAHSNILLIDSVADYLSGHGIEAQTQVSADGVKADLIATIGPAEPGGVILSGHTHDALPEPVLVGETIIVASGSNGKFVSRVDLDVRERRDVEEHAAAERHRSGKRKK